MLILYLIKFLKDLTNAMKIKTRRIWKNSERNTKTLKQRNLRTNLKTCYSQLRTKILWQNLREPTTESQVTEDTEYS